MNTDSFEKKADLLLVMANAHRLRMLKTLAEREVAVNNLADIIGISQSALSQHLAKLRSRDLVKDAARCADDLLLGQIREGPCDP